MDESGLELCRKRIAEQDSLVLQAAGDALIAERHIQLAKLYRAQLRALESGLASALTVSGN